MIRISATRDGFRRCGMAHTRVPVDHPDGTFSAEEIEVLQNEPLLSVTVIDDDGVVAQTPPPDEMTVPELKALLEKLEVPYAKKANKPDLVRLVMDNTGEPAEA